MSSSTAFSDIPEAESPSVSEGGRAPRRTAKLDLAAMTITVEDANGASTYHINTLPQRVRDMELLRGVWLDMRAAPDPDDAFTRFQAGELPKPREAKAKRVNQWRIAAAHAIVEKNKKSGNPVSLDEALGEANKMDASTLRTMKKAPMVLRHYHRLNGGGDPDAVLVIVKDSAS